VPNPRSLLSLGIDSGSNFVSSDVNTFRVYSCAAITLEDGEYAVLSQVSYSVRKIKTDDTGTNELCKVMGLQMAG
jgi:glucosamine 6-phosphate synthetase-like amidotransferase/phosphosugar isomerase protein